MTGFYATAEVATGSDGQSAQTGRVGSLATTLSSLALAATGHVQAAARAGGYAATLSGMSLSGTGHVQSSSRAGTMAITLSGMSLAASGHAQVSGRSGALLATLAGVSLGSGGHAQPAARLGQLATAMAGIQLTAVGHAQRAGRQGVMVATFGGMGLSANGGAFPFRRSQSRTYRISPSIPSESPLFTMTAGARLDFSFDWSDWMKDAGDEIAGYSIRQSDGVVRSGVMKDGEVISAFLTSTRSGYNWPVACDIVTAAGRTDSRKIVVRVLPR